MVKGLLNYLCNECAVVSPHRLNAFAIHLIRSAGLCPQHSGVSLLVHQQVREVNLFELKLDRLDEKVANVCGSFLSKSHRLFDAVSPKLDHD